MLTLCLAGLVFFSLAAARCLCVLESMAFTEVRPHWQWFVAGFIDLLFEEPDGL